MSRRCVTSKCWGRKCIYDTEASLEKCFKLEVAQYISTLQCKTPRRWGGNRVLDMENSVAKWFIVAEATCLAQKECITHYCHLGKWVKNYSWSPIGFLYAVGTSYKNFHFTATSRSIFHSLLRTILKINDHLRDNSKWRVPLAHSS